ncbi:hypothetical protein A3Q56_01484 [Intoshia linei]|uniref:Uncharacterized protein n=1 Tax=Intoshia linei TaxID=1819745 RepID=A0A177BAY2_9BILA|nr:hypothetical protein A3Q56_01484 [Intoshia linei]
MDEIEYWKKNYLNKYLNRLNCHKNEQFSTDYCITSTKGVPLNINFNKYYKNLCALSQDNGFLHIFDVGCRENEMSRTRFQVSRGSAFDVIWGIGNNLNRVINASATDTMAIWDVNSHKSVNMMSNHRCSIKTIDILDENVLIGGGRDGNIILWDTRTENPTFILENSHDVIFKKRQKPIKSNCSVTCVKKASDNILQFMTSGSRDCKLKLWDARRLKTISLQNKQVNASSNLQSVDLDTIMFERKNVRTDFSPVNMVFNQEMNTIYVSCVYNIVKIVLNQSNEWERHSSINHSSRISYFSKSTLNYNGSILFLGSSNGNMIAVSLLERQFNQTNVISKSVHSTNLDAACVASTHYNGEILVTAGDDALIKFWRYNKENVNNYPISKTQINPPIQNPITKFYKSKKTPLEICHFMNQNLSNLNCEKFYNEPVLYHKSPVKKDWLTQYRVQLKEKV